jgi:hypothetical protein
MPERNTDGRSVGRIVVRKIGPAEERDNARRMSKS